jgi:anti-sigma factor RsiW
MGPRPELCERARIWASLRLDGELSELESSLLAAHLDRCPSCRTFAEQAHSITRALQEARVEEAHLVVLPGRRAHRAPIHLVQSVAVALIVLATSAYAALSGSPHKTPAPKPVAIVASLELPDQFRELRRAALLEQVHGVPRDRRIPGEPV